MEEGEIRWPGGERGGKVKEEGEEGNKLDPRGGGLKSARNWSQRGTAAAIKMPEKAGQLAASRLVEASHYTDH